MSEELFACPDCGSHAYSILMGHCRDLLYRCPGEWDLAECNRCELIFTLPLPSSEKILDYYPLDYGPHRKSTVALRTNAFGNLFRRLAMSPYSLHYGVPEWNEMPFGNGKLLDVGCGAGLFLGEASRLGWRCWGIDVSPAAVQVARQNSSNVTVWVGTLDNLDPNEKFALINLSHVLEHLPNPRRALSQCFEQLASGGRLQVSVPNITSLEAKLFGRYWRGLELPRHLIHLKPAVLERLLCDVGFTSVATRPAMFASSISESLILSLPEVMRYRLLHSPVARLLYLSLIFPASLSYLMGNAGVIEVVAQKP